MEPSPKLINRRSSDALLVLVQQVHDNIEQVRKDVKGFDKRLDEARITEARALAEAVSDLMTNAFPEGDPSGHKRAHEEQMQAISDKAEFWRKMRFELSRAGLVGFLVWATVQLWHGVLQGPSK